MGRSAANLASEPELADRVRCGDRQALVQLYRRHRESIFRHAWRMLQDEAAALDVVQESFVRAMEAAHQTRPGLNFRAWVFRIATNLCLRELNRRGRSWLDPDVDARQSPLPAPDPARRREVGELLAAALARLPDRYRQILLLRELEELSYGELAQVLEVNEGNVKVLLHRARTRFAALFIAERLRADPGEDRGQCDELTRLLRRGSRAQLEQHLEQCPGCRQLELRQVSELLLLVPPPPAVTLPEAPVTGAPATTTASAAPTTVIGLVLGATLLAGSAVAGVTLLHQAHQARGREQPSVSERSATKRPRVSRAGPALPQMQSGGAGGRSGQMQSGGAGGRRGADAGVRGRRSHRPPRRPPHVIQQARDPEEPPPGLSN